MSLRFDLHTAALWYALIAFVWIVLSELVLGLLVVGVPLGMALIQVGKGLLFVMVTAALLHWRMSQKADQIDKQTQVLEVAVGTLRAVFEASPLATIILDADGKVTFWNRSAETMLGWSSDETMGKLLPNIPPERLPEHHRQCFRVLSGETLRGIEGVRRCKDGREIVVSAWMSPIYGQDGRVSEMMVLLDDVTERKKTMARVEHLAHYDSLTDLPNRLLFAERLQHAIALGKRLNRRVAVLFVDLDHFKNINDTLGHAAGDELLLAVARQFRSRVREPDTVARLGGDEFGIVLNGVEDTEAATAAAQRMLAIFAEPIEVGAQRFAVTGSIGLALFPDDATTREDLLRCADLAMYDAKAQGRNQVRAYSPTAERSVRDKVALEGDLRGALARNELWVAYQPQVCLRTGRVIGLEALLRWTHPERGTIPAADFIQLAENSGVIIPIGAWLVDEVCSQMAAWRASGFEVMPVSLNLSAVQFHHGATAEHLLSRMALHGLPAGSIEVEITESVLMHGEVRVLQAIGSLRHAGIGIAVDDFGTGYSSLLYLRRFPVGRLKIDMSFVRGMLKEPDDASIVRAIIGLGHSLRLAVLAEGVETEEEAALLRAEGCDEAQGYLYGRPVAAAELEAVLPRRTGERHLDAAVAR